MSKQDEDDKTGGASRDPVPTDRRLKQNSRFLQLPPDQPGKVEARHEERLAAGPIAGSEQNQRCGKKKKSSEAPSPPATAAASFLEEARGE